MVAVLSPRWNPAPDSGPLPVSSTRPAALRRLSSPIQACCSQHSCGFRCLRQPDQHHPCSGLVSSMRRVKRAAALRPALSLPGASTARLSRIALEFRHRNSCRQRDALLHSWHCEISLSRHTPWPVPRTPVRNPSSRFIALAQPHSAPNR
jgi:hypothetical protein